MKNIIYYNKIEGTTVSLENFLKEMKWIYHSHTCGYNDIHCISSNKTYIKGIEIFNLISAKNRGADWIFTEHKRLKIYEQEKGGYYVKINQSKLWINSLAKIKK